ncbi:hypothetical protein V8D89_004653 [Ganoderma adspersum]
MFWLPFHALLLLFPPSIAVVFAGLQWPLFCRLSFCYTTYIAALVVSVVAYRMSPFHPLYRYPGPFWYWTSIFCHAIRATGGRQAARFRALHDAYGDIVRIGPNHLSIGDPSFVGAILGASGIPKGPRLEPVAVKGYEDVMFSRVQQLIDLLEGQKGAPLSLGRWLKYFAYDFTSDMVGGGSEQMCGGDRGNIWAIADKGAEIAYFLGQIPWLGAYLGYLPGVGGAVSAAWEHCRKKTIKRLERGSSRRELLYYLNNEDLPEEVPPPTLHLLEDSVLATAAPSKTVSAALVSIFHCLLSNPEAYAALQDEIDRFYPSGADAGNTAHYRDMHYLNAVIHETLRLLPPAATSTPRQVPDDAATVVLGLLPPGTCVSVLPYVLHRDARNFPERSLVASGQLPLAHRAAPESESGVVPFQFVHNSAAFIPFSHGPMGCAGKGLAMLEMRAVVCALAQRFRIRIRAREAQGHLKRDGEPEENKSYLTANRLELPVVLEPRW